MQQKARDIYRCAVCGGNGAFLDGPHGREFVCVSCPQLNSAGQRLDDEPPAWWVPRATGSDETRLEWFDESLDPEKWFKPGKVVFAWEAALLLCGHNPDWCKRGDGSRDPVAGVVDVSMTDHHARLLEYLETAQPTVDRTLAQWRDVARESGFEYDARVDGLFSPMESSQSATGRPDARPRPKYKQQEDAVLQIIEGLGYAATALPPYINGKASVKAEVRAKLQWTSKVFDLTWERLRKDGRIA
jgi:hypothetical protein